MHYLMIAFWLMIAFFCGAAFALWLVAIATKKYPESRETEAKS